MQSTFRPCDCNLLQQLTFSLLAMDEGKDRTGTKSHFAARCHDLAQKGGGRVFQLLIKYGPTRALFGAVRQNP